MKYDPDHILIQVLQGKETTEERGYFEQWLQESETNRQVFQSLQAYWLQKDSLNKELKLTKERIWNERRSKQAKGNFDWKPLRAAAAIILIVLSVGYFLKDELVSNPTQPRAEQAVSMINKSATAGAKLETILPDGSLVKLNSESSLQYPSNFNDSARVVYLQGEAYFEVIHNPAKPFSVISKDVKTTVLGTSFVVSAYQDDQSVKIALASGKVQTEILNIDNQSINLLTPGEYIDYKENKIEKGVFNKKEVFGWKDGLLFFKNNSYSQAIAKLERWFGVEFVLEGAQPTWRLNGEYQNANLESIVEAMSYSQGFEYEFINEKLIKIMNK
jgi:ferric-dicitrate binding protein FerR (iron transport regulator)